MKIEDEKHKSINKENMSDPFRKIGSFAETAPEDRYLLLKLIEEAYSELK